MTRVNRWRRENKIGWCTNCIHDRHSSDPKKADVCKIAKKEQRAGEILCKTSGNENPPSSFIPKKNASKLIKSIYGKLNENNNTRK
jgi:hypothetical protein